MKLSQDQQKIVDDAVDKLREHFDSVLILVTHYDGETGSTHSYEVGSGNNYAQLGQVREWLGIQDQYQREYAKRKDAEGQE